MISYKFSVYLRLPLLPPLREPPLLYEPPPREPPLYELLPPLYELRELPLYELLLPLYVLPLYELLRELPDDELLRPTEEDDEELLRLTEEEELRVLLGRLYEEPAPLRKLLDDELLRLIVDDVELPRRTTSSLPVRTDDERTAPDCDTPVRLPVTTRTDELREAPVASVRDDDVLP